MSVICKEAKVKLFVLNQGTKRRTFQWIISCCPYCGQKHYHGAGNDIHKVKDFLGYRSPHCLKMPEGIYELVWDDKTPLLHYPPVRILPQLNAMGIFPRLISTSEGPKLKCDDCIGENWINRLIVMYKTRIIEELTAQMIDNKSRGYD